jgi:peptidoglycan/LPS O-acetylase OafA/YrhL
MTEGSFRLGYRPALDGVRAVAILSVVAFHYRTAFPFAGGFFGVELFFVLSGFLITSVLLTERAATGRVALARFYMRRALRLFPAVALVAAAVVVYALVDRPRALAGSDLKETLAALTYTDNWYQAILQPPETLLGNAWSLSVEEQFYLLWPIALLVALRRSPRLALALALAGTGAGALAHLGEARQGVSTRYLYVSLEGRVDALLIGAALAIAVARGYLARPAARRIGRLALAPAIATLLVFTAAGHVGGLTDANGGFTVFSVATAIGIANLVLWPSRLNRVLEWRPIVRTGAVSYGVYLWHQPIFLAISEHVSSTGAAVAVALPLTAAVAFASYRYVETPFLKRKRRYEWHRAGAAAALPEAAASGVGGSSRVRPSYGTTP